jgi:hypothetical protein
MTEFNITYNSYYSSVCSAIEVFTMDIGFTAIKRFGPKDGEAWDKYVQWSGLTQLIEVISLDHTLCPNFFRDHEIVDADWTNLKYEGKVDIYRDPDYLRDRIGTNCSNYRIIAVAKNPLVPEGFSDSHFEFVGYDLIEDYTTISALTNCGGFPDVFRNEELSEFGLITNYERAVEVQRLLREYHPEEPHAICDLYAIWRSL